MANKQPIIIESGRLANIDSADTLDVPSLNITAADSSITIPEHTTAPGTPAAGKVVIYAKADGLIYSKDDAGGEIVLGSSLIPINNQVGTTYQLAASDAGGVVRASNASPITVTIPENTTTAFPVGTSIAIRQVGAGQITLALDDGVVLNVPVGFDAITGRQGATIAIHKVDEDEWDLTGDLAEEV